MSIFGAQFMYNEIVWMTVPIWFALANSVIERALSIATYLIVTSIFEYSMLFHLSLRQRTHAHTNKSHALNIKYIYLK